MNGLRLLARVVACLVGLGGVSLSLINLPWRALTASTPPPGYIWSNIVIGALMPLLLCLAITIGLLLIARVDERLERLQGQGEA